jgi:hypothetical protein
MSLWSFQGARAFDTPHGEKPARRPVSQNSAASDRNPVPGFSLASAINYIEVDVVLGESDAGRLLKLAIDGSGASGVRAPDSLERR